MARQNFFMPSNCNWIFQHAIHCLYWDWRTVANRICFTTRFQPSPWSTDSLWAAQPLYSIDLELSKLVCPGNRRIFYWLCQKSPNKKEKLALVLQNAINSMVKKLELAVSLEFISQPQHSPPTCLSPPRSRIYHPERNAIIREMAMNYCFRVRGKRTGTPNPFVPEKDWADC